MRRASFTMLLLLLSGLVGEGPNRAANADESSADASVEKSASLAGRVLYDGPPPAPRQLRIPLRRSYFRDGLQVFTEKLPERRRLKDRGVADESLLVDDDGGIANVVVWLRSKDVRTGPHRGPLPHATLRALDDRFDPHVLPFWIKSPLVLTSHSEGALNFHLQGHAQNRLLSAGQSVEIKLKKPAAVPTPVASNIRPWFSAYILPLSHPYFAVTDTDGTFEITNLLLGEWQFAMWHERVGWLKTERFPTGRFAWNVQGGENTLGDIKVAREILDERSE